MIRFKSSGSFKHSESWFGKLLRRDYLSRLNEFGRKGVDELIRATPRKTGTTANSWTYEIVQEDGKSSIYWNNSNEKDGVKIAVIIQYGHGTGTGGFVQGIDYINPALQPIFQQIADEAWKEVCGK